MLDDYDLKAMDRWITDASAVDPERIALDRRGDIRDPERYTETIDPRIFFGLDDNGDGEPNEDVPF